MSARRMFAEELDFVWRSILGTPARNADLRIVDLLGGGEEAVADYIWDHWMGEPKRPTRQQVLASVIRARKAFMKMAYPDSLLEKERLYGSKRAPKPPTDD